MAFFRKNPLVSVIIASYNHEGFIKEAVESVLKQSIGSIEVIIVDDGSSDKTPEIIAKIKDPRIKFIPIPENRKIHPRNFALKIAKGKYIAFQNSDDAWDKNKLKEQVAIIEQDLEISACFTDVEIIDENGKNPKESWANDLFTNENRDSAEWLRHFFSVGNCVCISSALIPRKKIKEVGFFKESFIQLGDFDLWVRLATVGEFKIINKKLTQMRVIGGKNISEPSPSSHRRFVTENIELLGRYTKEPILGRLKEVFGSVLPENATTKTEILGGLAKYAWTLSVIHVVFANRLMGKMIDDSQKREELVRFYGPEIIHEYIRQKGRVDMGIVPDE